MSLKGKKMVEICPIALTKKTSKRKKKKKAFGRHLRFQSSSDIIQYCLETECHKYAVITKNNATYTTVFIINFTPPEFVVY